MDEKPWVSGPEELLNHASNHLELRSSFDCRIAFISIDNAVELSIKTFLNLPKRARGFDGPTRKELENASSFPDLLDLLERYGESKTSGIELGDLEWYHRLRNSLYHDGNGITVEPEKVDAYYQIAELLFHNLFSVSGEEEIDLNARTLLGEFILKWAELENRLHFLSEKHLPKFNRGVRNTQSLYDGLISKGVINSKSRYRLQELMQIRNTIVHSYVDAEPKLLGKYIEEINSLLSMIPKK